MIEMLAVTKIGNGDSKTNGMAVTMSQINGGARMMHGARQMQLHAMKEVGKLMRRPLIQTLIELLLHGKAKASQRLVTSLLVPET